MVIVALQVFRNDLLDFWVSKHYWHFNKVFLEIIIRLKYKIKCIKGFTEKYKGFIDMKFYLVVL